MTSAEKQILDIQHLYRIDYERGHSWQFRVSRGDKYHSKHFSDSDYGTPDGALEVARAYRNEYFSNNPSMGGTSRSLVRLRLPSNNRTGILGVSYTEGKLPSGNHTKIWQMSCPRPEGGNPRTASFSVLKVGEVPALMMAVIARRDATIALLGAISDPDLLQETQQVIDGYNDVVAELQAGLDNGTESEILSIIREARLDATSKQAQIYIRLGHHRFRRLVLARWNGCCAVTGADILVMASHIKPWRNSSNFDRINPYNGLALSPLYDRAFDQGLITFGDDGWLMYRETYRERLMKVGINLTSRIFGLDADHQPYLQHHRTRVFVC